MKRTISALLLIAMLASVSCESAGTGNDITSDDTTVSESTETSAETNDRENVKDNLPETDFGGDKFTMLVRTERSYEFEAEEENGDLLNDAVYKRNLAVEDRFNIKFDNVLMDSVWGDQATQFTNSLRTSIQAGEGAYDIVASYAATIPALVSQGVFANWSDMKYVDFSKPWWSEKVKDEMTINGKCFMITGDISLTLWEGMTCVMFNKKLADNYGIGNMYDLVKEGNWTFDKMLDITKDRYQDLDGDGKLSAGDRFGSLSDLQSGRALLWSSGMELCTHDENGNLVPTLTTEKNYDIFKSVLAFYEDNANSYGGDNGRMFMADQALFLMSSIDGAVQLRDMESDFGAIPYPKYDAADESYRSRNFGSSYFAIPITANNADMSATVLEAQNFYSYRDVRPTYYDTILKGKVSRDEETREMFDLVLDTCYIDTFFIYGSNLSFVADLPFNTVLEKQDKYMSSMKVQEKIVNKLLGKLAEAIQPENLG